MFASSGDSHDLESPGYEAQTLVPQRIPGKRSLTSDRSCYFSCSLSITAFFYAIYSSSLWKCFKIFVSCYFQDTSWRTNRFPFCFHISRHPFRVQLQVKLLSFMEAYFFLMWFASLSLSDESLHLSVRCRPVGSDTENEWNSIIEN